ncbi:MAG TPA: M15 family metallopeptidase, partial [Treponemataceae bacterium]|nr:M15 family metallopeptidase [Treponemataceae bacterium]
TPLKLRWIPPEKVISIFEEEGFVWGGKWIIWDNMHFEYRPDILLYSEK